MFFNLVTRSQSFSKPMFLDCDLHKCSSVFFFFFPPLHRWDRMARVEWSGVEYFLTLGQFDSDIIPTD